MNNKAIIEFGFRKILRILQISDEVFVISRIIKVVGVITLIILDIAKIVSNNCLIIH